MCRDVCHPDPQVDIVHLEADNQRIFNGLSLAQQSINDDAIFCTFLTNDNIGIANLSENTVK
jgi:hypothetical protein